MTEEDRKKIISNEYIDLFIEPIAENYKYAKSVNGVINRINDEDAIIYLPIDKAKENPVDHRYPALPRYFGLLDQSHLEESGVSRIQNIPTFNLRGQGVLLGFIDTGIDYTNSVFQNADKTTRILSIWDQTIENLQASEDIFYYGTEYTADQINLALQNETPFSVVPSKDEIGHGTSISALAGGSETELSFDSIKDTFRGVATMADYVIVKLKPAKTTSVHFYPMPENTICYQESDIMCGIQYLFNTARRLNRPIAICISLGTNQGSHDGLNPLNQMLSNLANRKGVAIIVGSGNESMLGHHYRSYVEKNDNNEYKKTVDLMIAEGENNFIMEIWGKKPAIYSIGLRSPSGDILERIPISLSRSTRKFTFDNTTVTVEYYNTEPYTGDQLILVYFDNPAPKAWHIDIYGNGVNILSGFDIWIPMSGFLKESTQLSVTSELTGLISPTPETTLTSPSDTPNAITITAYNHVNQSILNTAGRGYTRNQIVKPDLAAPGASILCPTLDNEYATKSGTSIAAAIATGSAAMALEWGIVKGNLPFMNCVHVKSFFINGAKKVPNQSLPNNEWGYGIMDVYESFRRVQT